MVGRWRFSAMTDLFLKILFTGFMTMCGKNIAFDFLTIYCMCTVQCNTLWAGHRLELLVRNRRQRSQNRKR
jgi:hypothetical protein